MSEVEKYVADLHAWFAKEVARVTNPQTQDDSGGNGPPPPPPPTIGG